MDRYEIISGQTPPPAPVFVSVEPKSDSTNAQVSKREELEKLWNEEHSDPVRSGDFYPMPSSSERLTYNGFDADSMANYIALDVSHGDVNVRAGNVRANDPISEDHLATKRYVDRYLNDINRQLGSLITNSMRKAFIFTIECVLGISISLACIIGIIWTVIK